MSAFFEESLLLRRLAVFGWRTRLRPALSRRLWAVRKASCFSSAVPASVTLRMAVRMAFTLLRFLARFSRSVLRLFSELLLLAKNPLLSQD